MAHPRAAVLRPEGEQQQRAGVGDRVDHAFEKRLRAGVEPLQVLDENHFRIAGSLGLLEAVERREEAVLAGLGAHRRDGAVGAADA